MTRRLRKPGPGRVYSYSAPEAMTTVLPVVPQRAPRRQRHWLPILVAALVGLPIGALAAVGLFVLILVCTPGTLP